jgi:DNA-binding NarL/FixJ family response regulator
MDEFQRGTFLTEKIIEETIGNGPAYYRPARLTFARTVVDVNGEELVSLTRRETEVLSLIAKGLSNKQVGRVLFISRNTVRAHLYSIYSKFGVGSRTAAARIAFDLGL